MRRVARLLFPVVAAVAAVTVTSLPLSGTVTAAAPTVVSTAPSDVVYGGFVSGVHADGSESVYALSQTGTIVPAAKKSFAYIAPKENGRNPARWNRCEPIYYLINSKGMPKAAASAIRPALKKVSQATGLRFINAGATKTIPFSKDGWSDRFLADDRNVLVIASATTKQVSAFRSGALGYGGPQWRIVGGGDPEIVLGGVVVNRAGTLDGGFAARDGSPTWGQLWLHEFGHAMNLGHVEDRTQIMYPTLTVGSPTDFGDGDRAGLQRLRNLPCFKN